MNIPSGYPQKELDKRQKEIQQFGFNYERMSKQFNDYENEKYKFKDQITEDYTKKEEFKYMGSDELLALHENEEKLCPHIHIPFQSGSDEVLKRMFRGYKAEDCFNFVEKIQKLKRKISVTTDMII